MPIAPVERGLERRFDDPAADLSAGLGERGDVVDVEVREADAIFAGEIAVGQEFAERGGSGGEAAGHADARVAELADHFAERGVLAADFVDVGHAQALEGNDAGRRAHWNTFALRAAVQVAPCERALRCSCFFRRLNGG